VEPSLKIAILSANGLITESLLAAIENHPSLSGEIALLGNAGNLGTGVEFGQQTLLIEDVEECGFDEIDIVVATGELPYEGDWLDRARQAGCIILDIGGHLPGQRYEAGVVAGVNNALLDEVAPGAVVVLPDAATVQSATLLQPLLQKLDIKRVSLFSCHAVSERGRSGVEEMVRQTAQLLNGKPIRPLLFSHQMAFNLVPISADEVSGEPVEMRSLIAKRLAQVLKAQDLPITVNCCWAPVFYGHTQVLHCSAAAGVELETLQRLLSQLPCVDTLQDPQDVPTVVSEASGSDYITVGKLSVDVKNSTEFSLWAVADNLRFGIAGNAVKIIELLVKRLFISYS
jgi:aspartate-semialdehyde dehydrogenase